MSKSLRTVEACNALDDETYKSRLVPELNADSDVDIHVEFASAAELWRREKAVGREKSELEACFQLLRSTSIDDYDASSMGWSTADKRKEMKLPDMRYILVKNRENEAFQGFISFMITYEDGYEVVYIYEVHLSESLRGKGFGKKLVQFVEGTGTRAGMSKVMLTVFMRNEAAYRFYQRLGYSVDDFSPPPRKLRNGVVKEPDYRILSKKLARIDQAAAN